MALQPGHRSVAQPGKDVLDKIEMECHMSVLQLGHMSVAQPGKDVLDTTETECHMSVLQPGVLPMPHLTG